MRTEYYRNLHSNPSIRLKWFVPLIERAIETGKEITTKKAISLNGYDYTLYFTPAVRTDPDGQISLTLKWRDEGESYTQTITIVQEESNLISGSFVYYFLCPYGYKSRQLFYIANRSTAARTKATANETLTTLQSLTGGTERNATGESLHPTGNAV